MIQKTAKFGVFTLPTTTHALTEDDSSMKPNLTGKRSSSKHSHPLPQDIPAMMPVLTRFSEEERVDLTTLATPTDIFAALYRHYSSENTYAVSLQERKYINADKSNPLYKTGSLTYGEICDMEAVDHMFGVLQQQGLMTKTRTGKFYDLGSGSGKVIVAAALLHSFESCCGIEILASLHGIADIVQAEYHRYFTSPRLEVYHGSITDLTLKDWTDGDIIYVNSTCFSNELFAEMASIAKKMKVGSIMITLSQVLPKATGFRLFHESRETMSWGEADYYFHKKIE